MDNEVNEKRETLLNGIFRSLDVDDFFDAFSKCKPEERVKTIIELFKLTKSNGEVAAIQDRIIFRDGKVIVQKE